MNLAANKATRVEIQSGESNVSPSGGKNPKYHYRFFWVVRTAINPEPAYVVTSTRYTEDEARVTFGDRLVQPVLESMLMQEIVDNFF